MVFAGAVCSVRRRALPRSCRGGRLQSAASPIPEWIHVAIAGAVLSSCPLQLTRANIAARSQYFHKTNAIGGCNTYGLPFECCVANGNQGWPRFTSHMYAVAPNGGLAALLYAPNEVDVVLDDTNDISIKLETEYPFDERLNFTVVAVESFPFSLRIPGWAVGATLAVGSNEAKSVPNGTFQVVTLPAGPTTLQLLLPMPVRIQEEQAGGISVHAGALLFALDLKPKVCCSRHRLTEWDVNTCALL
eukprot:SAG31_NODE_71_length_28115_cov_4.128105_18_plen_246_part_00